MSTGACARVWEGARGSHGRERSVSDRCTELREVHGVYMERVCKGKEEERGAHAHTAPNTHCMSTHMLTPHMLTQLRAMSCQWARGERCVLCVCSS